MSGEENHHKGKTFEEQVARFLEKRGWETMLGRHFKGRIAVRKHDCDIFATKRSLGWRLVTLVCLSFAGFGVAYWFGWFTADLPHRLLRSMDWLVPLSFLLGLLAAKRSTKYVWVECKNLQESIKRDLIIKLQYQFRDVRKFGSWECWLVSTSRFDEDAIVHARAHKVTCYRVVEPGRRNMALHRVDSKTGDV